MIGKTNLDQFATGLVGMRSPYGVPRNALRAGSHPGRLELRAPRSRSAAGLVPFSLGTDTAGSGRVPAALNGIVGLKPSLGALSASGVVPACRTLDTISIFALDVADAFRVFEAAAAFDPADPWSRPFPAPARSGWPKGLRLGVPRRDQLEFFGDEEAEAAFARDVAAAQALGANVVEFDIEPFAEVARLLYEGPWVAERYAATKPLIENDPGALHPVTRAIIEGARKFDAVAAFEASYKLAGLRRRTQGAWAAFDVMVVPTMPRPYTVAEVEADPVRLNSRLGTYTNFVNLLDLAAIACPSGMRGDGLPSSLTLIGPSGADGYLAGLAAEIQARSGAPMGATGLAVPPPAPAPPSRLPAASRSRWSARISPDCRSIVNCLARGRIPARGGDDRRLPALRVARHEAAEARPPAGRGRGGRGDPARALDARQGGLRRLRRRDSRSRSASGRSGFPTDQAPRAFWSRRRRSRAPRTSRSSAAGAPTSPPAELEARLSRTRSPSILSGFGRGLAKLYARK